MNQIDLTVTIDKPAEIAESVLLDRVDARLHDVGLTGRNTGGTLVYRPRFIGLFFVWLVRRLADEHVTFTLEGKGPVTQVHVTGKLRNRAHAEVTEALGGY
jgi:hypothetical protein